jgi:hypothetical protein
MAMPYSTPRDGDLYECIEDISLRFLVHWRAPFTSDGAGTLPKGTTVRLMVSPRVVRPTTFRALPIDKEAIETLLVPFKERTDEKYGGISLTITAEDLSKSFRLLRAPGDEAI